MWNGSVFAMFTMVENIELKLYDNKLKKIIIQNDKIKYILNASIISKYDDNLIADFDPTIGQIAWNIQ